MSQREMAKFVSGGEALDAHWSLCRDKNTGFGIA
jgi:hypothetical protein